MQKISFPRLPIARSSIHHSPLRSRSYCAESLEHRIQQDVDRHLIFLNHSGKDDLDHIRQREKEINDVSELKGHLTLKIALLNAYATCGARIDAERKFIEVVRGVNGPPRSPKLWSHMLDCDLQHDDLPTAMNRFQWMMELDVEPNDYIWNAFCDYHEKRGQLMNTYELFSRSKYQPNRNCWLKLMWAFGKSAQIDAELMVYYKMKKLGHGLTPGEWTMLLDSLCTRRRVDCARSLMKQMRPSDFPHEIAWSTILDAQGKRGQIDDMLQLLDQMKGTIMPDDETWSVALATLKKAGRRDEMMAIFNFVKSELRSSKPWNIILSDKKGKLPDLMALFNEMKSSKATPDEFTWTIVLAALGSANKFKEMLGMFYDLKPKLKDPHSWTAVMNALGKDGQIEEMMHIFKEMRDTNTTPDHTTWAVILNAHGKAGRVTELLWLFEEMKEFMDPNDIMWTSILSTLGKSAIEDMLQLWNDIKNKVTSPHPWNAVINALAKEGRIKEMLSTLAEMKTTHTKPDVVTWCTIITELSRANLEADMQEVIQEARKQLPHAKTINHVIRVAKTNIASASKKGNKT
eukprot:TRINITY_DN8558_c0_g1_i1.p1 TRINITY_DN8558_c0_g1~~TRINITY_DN8558_c0_g1_i1.p1  ORF type:complete len:574 (-),score=152.69 TRINITY_DN8558_c0_g1_i1:8-1729(-)